MAIKVDIVESFEVNEVGETTKEQLVGVFKVKTRLSFREQLRMDQLKREILGPDPAGNASAPALAQANILAELAVRVTDAPMWWKESKSGLDLFDDNILLKVWEETRKLVDDSTKAKNEEGEAAAAELREHREQQEKSEQSAARKVPAGKK